MKAKKIICLVLGICLLMNCSLAFTSVKVVDFELDDSAVLILKPITERKVPVIIKKPIKFTDPEMPIPVPVPVKPVLLKK